MLLSALLVLTTLLPLAERPAVALRDRSSGLRADAAEPAPFYRPAERAVSNWRGQAADALRPVSLALVARFSDTEPAFVARCARLNNYWCIKSARWTGEIGADAQGHTGFATAADGAYAAAVLLQRYYRSYGRRTALAIVRRWAPAECRLSGSAPLAARGVPPALAPRGIGGTLRARYLARRMPGGARRGVPPAGRAALRVQPWSALARMGGRPASRPAARPGPEAADIATGTPVSRGVEDPAALLDRKFPSADRLVAESAALPPIAAGLSLGDLRAPAPLCGHNAVRIANYATAIARSVGLRAGDDLALFAPDGSPLPNLAPVMRAMSAVELGALHAGEPLVEAAIARLRPVAAPTADATK